MGYIGFLSPSKVSSFCCLCHNAQSIPSEGHSYIYLKWSVFLGDAQNFNLLQFSSVQSLSHVHLFATPWTAASQASLSITNYQSPPKLMSIELVMPSSHLILCRPLSLLPPIPPSIRVFPNESTSSHEVAKVLEFQPYQQSFERNPRADLLQNGLVGSPCSPRDSQESSPIDVQKHQFFSAQPSSQSSSHIHTWPQEKP